MTSSAQTDRLNSALADRYRIERELGAGGMATVYLAVDLKHKRKVAVKVLKPELAAVLGADRFVQEITTTASLQHPHILPLFDSGTADGFLYYVMPFIEGETLRDRLNRETQLGVDEAVRIAREVADALDYAHGKGIIHRDIKPENILIQNGRPMVADFGIALAVSAAAGGRMTETGLSLGTPHYMSPEQATAEKEISARSDVYSLASVLYEMLAGQPPHIGGSAQQIIMKIIAEPVQPVSTLRKSVPPNVAAAVAQALEKLPADRFQSARAFAEALGNPGFTGSSGTTTTAGKRSDARNWQWATVGFAALAAAFALLFAKATIAGKPTSIDANPPVRFPLASEAVTLHSASTRPFAISPDGRTVVFRAWTDSTTPHLWIRNIGDPGARRLEGTEDGLNAAFSPDGQTIAFNVQNRQLKILPIAGGAVRNIVTLDAITAAIDWASDEEILFEQIAPDGGISKVSINGGVPTLVIPLDSAAGEIRQRRPFMLREAGIIVYGSTAKHDEELVLFRPSDGRRVRPGLPGIGALAFIDEHLIYAGALGEVMTVRLNTRSMEVLGPPVMLTPRVAYGWTGSAVAISPNGTLVYRAPDGASDARLELVDTSGVVRQLPGRFGVHGTPRFSPNGRTIVAAIGTAGVMGRRMGVAFADLWLIDVTSGEPTRLTSDASAIHPSWFADGKRIVFGSDLAGKPVLRSVPVDGSAPPTTLFDFGFAPRYPAMLPDGKSVIVAGTRAGLVRSLLDVSGRVDTLMTLEKDGIRAEDPRVSPDGRWLAFIERSSYEVWVRSLTGPGLLQVSVKGTEGNPVTWGPDSRHLYYINTEGLQAIELQTTPTLVVKTRRLIRRFPPVTDYDLSPDGHTFVVVNPIRVSSDVIVVVNWLDEARRTWGSSPAK